MGIKIFIMNKTKSFRSEISLNLFYKCLIITKKKITNYYALLFLYIMDTKDCCLIVQRKISNFFSERKNNSVI